MDSMACSRCFHSVLLFILAAFAATSTVIVSISGADGASDGVRSAVIIEHPVFFNMAGLLENPENESIILQGLNDLVYNSYSDLYFLFSGRVLESKGVFFTHALISRFPSVQALRTYYDSAIGDIAKQMGPWLKREYCVDYVVEMDEDAIMLDVTSSLATHVTFIKASSNVTEMEIEAAMEAFLGLAGKTDYAMQLTCGENIYMKESYRTMSHGFSAYFSSVADMEKWQQEAAVVQVLQDVILTKAESYAIVSLVPFVSSAVVGAHRASIQ